MEPLLQGSPNIFVVELFWTDTVAAAHSNKMKFKKKSHSALTSLLDVYLEIQTLAGLDRFGVAGC